MFHLRRILVPVDFSKGSEKALQYASRFARQSGAELILLHVIPPAAVLATPDVALPGIIEESAESAREDLDELRKSIEGDVPTRRVLRNGSPPMEILAAAREMDVDFIVLATHGYSGLMHVLSANTAGKVMRRARCPVLIVREDEHDFIAATESGRAPELGDEE